MARPQYRYRKQPRRRIKFSSIMVALLLITAIAYPFWSASTLNVDERVVQIAGLHPNLKNMRIVFVSDIHEGIFFPQARVKNLISKINSLSPDIVIFGGDYAENSDGAVRFFKTAPQVHARLGVFGVVGDRDRTEPESNFSLLVAEMTNYGCIPLTNNIASVKVGQTYVHVIGADDYKNGTPDITAAAGQVSRDDFVIFAGHSPDLLTLALDARSKENSNHWFDLALFGHTHGGQVTIFGRPVFPGFMPEIGAKYLSGWREENRAHVLVSNGVGTSIFPIRLFAAPQIHHITLKAR